MSKEKTYRIGDACKQLDIQPYVLRYWETEFPPLSPDKSKAGQRLYTEADLAVIRRIKELLYDEGYTIAGAKKKLETELASGGPAKPAPRPAEKPAKPPATPARRAAAKPTPKTDEAADAEAVAQVQELEDQQRKMRNGVEKVLGEARALLESLAP
ncbi:MAG: MerR family transcriptional regulator [Thermoanaerobaculia bacterium]